MSNRFHNKFHRENHHSKRTPKNDGITDAAYDPLASYDYPFQGEFYTDGEIVTQTYLSAASAFADDIFIRNNATIGNDVSVNRNLYVGNSATVDGILTVNNNGYINGDLFITGSLSALGNVSQIDTEVFVTSAFSVENTGTGPALTITQHGSEPIAHFIDANGDDIVFDDNGNVGIGTMSPSEKLDVVGNVKISGTTKIQTLNTGTTDSVVTHSSGILEQRQANPSIWNTTAKFVSASDGSLTPGYLTKAENIYGINESIVYDNGTNIGIGTSTPGSKLHVVGEIVAENSGGDKTYIGGGTAPQMEIGSLTPASTTITFWNRANGDYMDVITRDATFVGTAFATGNIAAPSIGTDVGNSVVILNSSGLLKTDEINPSVWNTTAKFISASHLPLNTNYLAKFGDSFGVRDSQIFDNGVGVGIGTPFPLGAEKLRVAGNTTITGSLYVALTGNIEKAAVVGANPPRASFDIQKTDSMILPVGPTTGRIPLSGAIRYNSDRSRFEGYDGAIWRDLDTDLTALGLHNYLPLSGGTVFNLLCSEDFFVATNFTATSSTILPVGDSTTRVNTKGSIRYNIVLSAFEGFNGDCWDALGSVSDVDRDTYISSETTPCNDNDEIKFYAAGNEVITVNLSSVSIAKDSTSGVSTLYVLSSTKVGVNTETPNKELTVVGDISATGRIFGDQFIGSLADTDGDTYITTEEPAGSDNDEIKFYAQGLEQMKVSLTAVEMIDVAGTGVPVLYVNSNATGINTETPNKELTVFGDISASGDVYASNLYPLRRFDYIPGSPATSYTGISPFGYTESHNTWRVTKIEYASSGTVLSVTQAINVNWTNRYTHVYI